MQFLLAFFLLVSSPFAITPDTSAKSFESREKKNKRVDLFDFSKTYPNLENIEIDATRKKCVEFFLTGEFPVLESIHYEGSFGELNGKLTGSFPKLKKITFLTTSCAMDFDLDGKWEQSCEAHIVGVKGDITLKLPKNIGIIVKTKVGIKGKVIVQDMKKQERFGVLNKTYKNELAETSDIVLTLNVETNEGCIIIE